MDKVALIIQPFGIGDAIFARGVAQHFIDQGFKILWPVKPPFVDGLNRAYPNITYIPDDIILPEYFNIKEDKVHNSMRILPIRWSDRIVGIESKYWMKSKYMMYDLDYTKWKDYAMFRRDRIRETDLMRVLGIVPGEKYNLVGNTYRSNFTGNIPITVSNRLKTVVMDVKEGYSIFDWASIIQNATHIHVVNSAIFYLLELLDLMAEEIHLYSRTEENGFPYVDYLMQKKYILHQ